MRRMIGRPSFLVALLPLCLGSAATASIYFPPVTVDLSSYALQSQVPPPCPVVPLPDTLNGTLGSGSPCAARSDAARPTVVQAAIVTTDSVGMWNVVWAKGVAEAKPYINPQAINTSGQPYICNVAVSSATTASGKCWQTVTMTLPSLAASLLGLVLNPTSAAPSIQVRVAAREATQ